MKFITNVFFFQSFTRSEQLIGPVKSEGHGHEAYPAITISWIPLQATSVNGMLLTDVIKLRKMHNIKAHYTTGIYTQTPLSFSEYLHAASYKLQDKTPLATNVFIKCSHITTRFGLYMWPSSGDFRDTKYQQ
jgi:hypothetical protein